MIYTLDSRQKKRISLTLLKFCDNSLRDSHQKVKFNKQSRVWHFLSPKYSSTLLHQAAVCTIDNDVFANISNLHVSEKKGFGILFPPSDLEKISVQERRKSSTCTQYMLVIVCCPSSILFLEETLILSFLNETTRKKRKQT